MRGQQSGTRHAPRTRTAGRRMGNKQPRFTGGGKGTGHKHADGTGGQAAGGRPAAGGAAPVPPGFVGVPVGSVPVGGRPVIGGPSRFTGGGVALGSAAGGGSAGRGNAAGAAAAARFAGSGGGGPGSKPAKAAPTEEEMVMKMFVDAQLAQIDELVDSIQEAPPELVVPALELLSRIYGAIIDKPDEPKVRKIRCTNEKFVAHLGGLPVAMDFLEASGFIQAMLPIEGGAGEEECIVFPKDGSTSLLRQARNKLQPVLKRERPKLPQAPTAERPEPAGNAPKPAEALLIDISPTQATTSPTAASPHSEWLSFGGDSLGESFEGDEPPQRPLPGAGPGEEERQVATIHSLLRTLEGADASLLRPALDLIGKITGAILQQPGTPKVRSIKRRGAAFQKIEAFESLMGVMVAAGFEFRTDSDGESVVLPQGASLYVLGEMKSLCELHLKRISPAPVEADAAVSSSAARFDRETTVFARVEGGLDPSRIAIPDSFFEYSASDLRAASSGNQHMTKTMKEAMKPQFKFALIRVRLTDGYILQGKFRSSERIEAVKLWVDGCINTPDRIYHLSTMPPVRKITAKDCAGKSINDLGLAPGTLVNFFWADGVNEGANMVKRELLATARPLTVVDLPRAEGAGAGGGMVLQGSARPLSEAGGGGSAPSTGGGSSKIPAWMQKR